MRSVFIDHLAKIALLIEQPHAHHGHAVLDDGQRHRPAILAADEAARARHRLDRQARERGDACIERLCGIAFRGLAGERGEVIGQGKTFGGG